jgi:ribulose kinase
MKKFLSLLTKDSYIYLYFIKTKSNLLIYSSMLLLGIDIGTSSIKASVVDGETGQLVTSAQYPDTENTISSPLPDWAEQDPEMWWNCAVNAIQRCNNSGKYNPKDIQAIGMHIKCTVWLW